MSKRVYIAGGSEYHKLFEILGFETISRDDLGKKGADLVVFTGGADIDPELYDHPPHESTCWSNPRDTEDMKLFIDSMFRGIPMVGICRGAQFLNVMNGGKMYQHVVGGTHGRSHIMKVLGMNGMPVVSSTHHQVMMPPEDKHVVGFAPFSSTLEWWDGLSNRWMKEDVDDTPEAVFFEESKCLGFQPHPEHYVNDPKHPCIRAFTFLLTTKLKLEV